MFVHVDRLGSRKPAEYEAARRLRASQGLSFRRIAAQLGISPSTAHAWAGDVAVPATVARRPQAQEAVRARAVAWSQRSRDRRRAWQAAGRARARDRDPDHLAGCMLYWGEGSKSRNVAALANSDPHLLRVFRDFVMNEFGRDPASFAFRVNVHLGNGVTLRAIETFWLGALDLQRENLRAHVVDRVPTSSRGHRRARHVYGCGHLRVLRSTPIVQHIYGAIQEYGSFEEPAWLG